MLCVKNKLLFNELNMQHQNISRIIYLATFIDYNSNNANMLVKHGKNYKIEPMTRQDIKNILRLGKDAFIDFMSDIKENNLIWEVDGKYYLSDKYFTKGKSDFNNKEYTRIFIKSVRYIYNHTTLRQHSTLSYVYQLIPYMNWELNVICSNPLESDISKLKKMSLKEICSMLGLKTDRKSLYKFREKLKKFYIKVDNTKYYMFAYAVINNNIDYYVINPLIVWGGDNADNIRDIIKLCFFM